MDLSIVVPIYNVESYLEACLNSIEPILSNENVELILVNDGSKDGSEDICYKYIDKTTNNKQQTTNNKQQTTNNKQQTTNNKQQTTNTGHQISNIYIRITKDCQRREIPE
ncbi:glycosyltransferase family 2 protein [Neisseria meningitidis]|uniref:glycosyltransferase family 2 protein n=1 Tax=Neisseria meningitidis TaxID=487 RepID=UPI0002A4D12B|nr:glycosyltransferase [Neisseria meningitidis]ELK67277.1 glycosyl transferase 2 family protein [Neisseria meningitidis 97021]CWR55808.1 glycosyltransferase PglE [Neisseria meningitidis]